MRSHLPLLLVSTLAASASAQPLTGLYQWQVSADDGLTWSSSITINPGTPYRIRGLGSWTDGAVLSHGFAGLTFEQIDLIGADGSDVFGAAGGGGTPVSLTYLHGGLSPDPWSLQAGTGASVGSLKIDHTTPANRLNMSQIHYDCSGAGIPFLDYVFDNPIALFDMHAVAGNPKTLTISATWTRLGTPPSNTFQIYTNPCGTNRKPTQEAVMTDAHVLIVPCPADLNGDGIVDFADYLEFLNLFNAGDLRVDYTGDGVVDFADYLEFLNHFDAGC